MARSKKSRKKKLGAKTTSKNYEQKLGAKNLEQITRS